MKGVIHRKSAACTRLAVSVCVLLSGAVATDAIGANSAIRKGMTWTVLGQQSGYVHVGADAASNAYAGDTTIDQFLPILCVVVDGRTAPTSIPFDFNNGWLKG